MNGGTSQQLETFSTAGLEPRRNIEFWNDAACASFTPRISRAILDLMASAYSTLPGHNPTAPRWRPRDYRPQHTNT